MYLFRIFILFTLIIGCSSSKEDQQEETLETAKAKEAIGTYKYALLFGTIDSSAKVYVNEVEIPNLDLANKKNESTQVGLDNYLKAGENTVKVELYNGTNNLAFDKKWEIYYELYRGKEPIDFAHEKSANGEQGLVFEMTHKIALD